MEGRSLVDPTNSELAAAYGVNTELADPDQVFDVIVVGAGPGGLAGVGLRLLGGPRRAHHRAGVDRRPGGSELADPQLPRLRARCERRGAGPARLPAGVGLRLPLPADVGGHGAPDRGRPARPGHVERRGGDSPGPWSSPRVPPTAGSGSRLSKTSWAPACTTGPRGRRRRGHREAGLRSRWRQLRRPGGDAPLPLRGQGEPAGPRRSLAASMSQYLRDQLDACENVDLRFGTEVIDGCGDPRLETLTLRNRRTGDTETVPAAAPVRADRRAPEQRLASGHDRPRRLRVRAHGRGHRHPSTAGRWSARHACTRPRCPAYSRWGT